MSRKLPQGWAQAKLDEVADALDYEREPINSSERSNRISGKLKEQLFAYYGATGQVGLIDDFRSDGERVLLGEDGAPFLDSAKDKAYLVNGKFWVNNHAHVLQGAAGYVNNRFLCHQLNTVDYQPFVAGSTRVKLTSAAMKQIPLAVAPAAEQTRIVEKLEELLSDLDAGVAELKAAQKKLIQYRQSLLKAAVEGALTAEWRKSQAETHAESGAALLARIVAERRSRWEARQLAKFKKQGKAPPKDWQAKYFEPAAPDTAGLPALPQGWVWASLGQLVGDSSYGTSVKCSYESEGVSVLRIPNLVARKLVLEDLKFATQPLGLDESEYLAPGDILVVRTNGSISLVGRAAEVTEVLPGQFYFASYLLRVRCIETTVVPRWISAVLASSVGRRWIESRAASSAGQHNISLSTLLTIPIPLSPLAEQAESLQSLELMLSSLLQQELAIEVSFKQSAAQRRNILQAAFSGQLVPQDPADEPASALLARIRAERLERDKQPRVRKTRSKKEVSTMATKLIDVLAEAGDWVPAQEAFRRCGVADGAQTDQVELLYAELRELDKTKRLMVEPVLDEHGRKVFDRLKLVSTV